MLDERIIALSIFLLTYLYIATGKREKHISVMVGTVLMWIFGILTFETMLTKIDFDTLGILFGMMIIVGGLKESGFFRYIGLYIISISGYESRKMFIYLTILAALLSPFLANVTVVMFMTVIAIELSEILELDPKPYILSMIMASNIGGLLTLIGDPPNILIGLHLEWEFMYFTYTALPFTIATLAVTMIYLLRKFRDRIGGGIPTASLPLTPSEVITDRRLFKISLTIFIVTLTLFTLSTYIGLSVSTIAMISAVFLLFIGGEAVTNILKDVDWETLIFITCLFIIIGGLEEVGLIEDFVSILEPVIASNQILSPLFILWISSLLSGFIDNIPYTIALIPIIDRVSTMIGGDRNYYGGA